MGDKEDHIILEIPNQEENIYFGLPLKMNILSSILSISAPVAERAGTGGPQVQGVSL